MDRPKQNTISNNFIYLFLRSKLGEGFPKIAKILLNATCWLNALNTSESLPASRLNLRLLKPCCLSWRKRRRDSHEGLCFT
jgi:hypothetical protein